MDPKFRPLIDSLHPLHERLINCRPVGSEGFPTKTAIKGVYLYRENGIDFYVGRSNHIQKRFKQHFQGDNNSAPFAYKMAYIETGQTKASCKSAGGRKALTEIEPFRSKFKTAKARIQKMEFRWVEVDCAKTQAMLEIYSATVLGTDEHNSFENH